MVKLTRNDDMAMGDTVMADLQARADVANKWGADCFVSIHCNSANDPNANGTETFIFPGSSKGRMLAEPVHNRVVRALGTRDRGIKEAAFATGWEAQEFGVLRLTRCPAVLVELAFISNPTEEALLESESFQRKAAQAIAEGVAAYLGIDLLVGVPAWARDAARWVIDWRGRLELRGSEDFWRMVVLLHEYHQEFGGGAGGGTRRY
jgi:N-acetylmuramoyl-L-alanine amidase